jgi:hypothetical protein
MSPPAIGTSLHREREREAVRDKNNEALSGTVDNLQQHGPTVMLLVDARAPQRIRRFLCGCGSCSIGRISNDKHAVKRIDHLRERE